MRGGMRLVYGFRDPKVIGSSGGWMVAKLSRYIDRFLNSSAVVEAHAKSTAVARYYAGLFNEDLAKAKATSGKQSPFDASGLPVSLIFVPCYMYSASTEKGKANAPTDEQVFAAERYLPGIFVKYNSNNGYVLDAPAMHKDVVQAFLHYSFIKSGSALVVADLQGVARANEVLLTDPQVLTASPAEVPAFGPGDVGARGARNCLAAHRCGPTCRILGLKPVSAALLRKMQAPGDRSALQHAATASRASSSAGTGWEQIAGCSVQHFDLEDSEPRSSQASASSWVHLLDG